MTSVAIMQPTYLPWLGYFALMDSVDQFVLLDSVQFAKRSWQQRNQIRTPQGPQWLTVPVISKGLRDQTITEVQILYGDKFPQTHVRAIEMNYQKRPYFDRYFDGLAEKLNAKPAGLAKLTIGLINWFREVLGISTPVLRASELNGLGTKAALLASLCNEIGASVYVSPPGSQVYLDDSNEFENIGIPVEYFQYEHPEYDQGRMPFESNMSVVDLLFNEGPASVDIIRRGVVIN